MPNQTKGDIMNQIPYMDPNVARKGCLASLACMLIGPVLSHYLLPKIPFIQNLMLGILSGLIIAGIILRIMQARQSKATDNQGFVMQALPNSTPSWTQNQWEQRLADAARHSPMLAQQLGEVMWLDDYLMRAIRENPSKEYPEMLQAWKLCVQIAEEIGLPQEAGADWVSHHASNVGRSVGISPLRPR
jgi:hypothetical protein